MATPRSDECPSKRGNLGEAQKMVCRTQRPQSDERERGKKDAQQSSEKRRQGLGTSGVGQKEDLFASIPAAHTHWR